MLYAVPKLSNDEKAFLKVMIDPEMLANNIAAYASVVSETGGLRKRILSTNKKLERIGATFEDLKEDPKFEQALIVENAVRTARTDGVRKLSIYADLVRPELKTAREGIDLVRTLDAFTPFLSESQNQSLRKLEAILDFVDQHNIFVRHSLTAWPRQLSDKQVRPSMREYRAIVNRAYDVLRNPPAVKPAAEASLAATVRLAETNARDSGLRTQALAETHLHASLRQDPRLKELSARVLHRKINTLLKLIDNDSAELISISQKYPEVLFEQRAFGSFIRRVSLLNQLARREPLDQRSIYDPILADRLRAAFLDRLIGTDDQNFFSLYAKIRVAVKSAYADPIRMYPVVDQKFIEQVFPAREHPLKSRDLTPKAVIEFLKSDDFKVWKEDQITENALKDLILKKMAGRYVGASRDVWIKANFPALLGFEPLQKALDKLISKGEIVLTTPSNPSGSGLQLAR